MSAGEYCNREVVVVNKSEPVSEAVRLMRHHHTGDVVVVEPMAEGVKPVGILTDRDIVLEILAENVDLDSVIIGDIMSFDLAIVTEQTKLVDVVEEMRGQGVRRMPVVDGRGALVGIITVDDVLELVAELLQDMVTLIAREKNREVKQRNPCLDH